MSIIKSFRRGFAVNSSSDHSIVFIPSGSNWSENVIDQDFFGWDKFVLLSKKPKARYMVGCLFGEMEDKIGLDASLAIVHNWLGIKDANKISIDHQSDLTFPYTYDGKFISKPFLDDLLKVILSNKVAILGGNDNDNNQPAKNMPIIQSLRYSGWKCRKDGKFWTLFNTSTGDKVRFSFDPKAPKVVPKPATPELVDLKITSFCDAGCAWCYQSSNTKGIHAGYDDLCDIALALEDLQVFEVALGGGEPTEHPEFLQILKFFKDCNITPNFTTRSSKWLNKYDQVMELIGSFAYSVNSVQEAQDFEDKCKAVDPDNYDRRKFSFNYTLGTSTKDEFLKIMNFCRNEYIKLNVLGFKPVGRAVRFSPQDYTGWLQEAAQRLNVSSQLSYGGSLLGIDTMVAKQYKQELIDLKVPDSCYDIEEGKYSMYIDAVDGFVGATSYGPTELLINTQNFKDIIKKHFSKY